MAKLNFDTSAIESQTFEALPAGWYPVMIVDEEQKEAKSGNGEYVKMTLEVTEGPYKGRKLWEQFSLWHTNPQTVEIAQRGIATIAQAVGIAKCNDTTELHNRVFDAKVIIEKSDQYGDQNRIRGYRKHAGTAGPMAPPPQAQAPKAANAAPWKR
ncbi:MAG: DUF669 domain-containing protein [Thiobacillaceae bacterium]|jgi:hypothetical protein|nr:DUF669 domain-containing protein [Thiobacillaceae bacterium]